jgi:hypothetical protein
MMSALRVVLAVAVVVAALPIFGGAAAAQPDDAGPDGDILPDLPDQASDVAKDVLDGLRSAWDDGVEAVGDLISSISPDDEEGS